MKGCFSPCFLGFFLIAMSAFSQDIKIDKKYLANMRRDINKKFSPFGEEGAQPGSCSSVNSEHRKKRIKKEEPALGFDYSTNELPIKNPRTPTQYSCSNCDSAPLAANYKSSIVEDFVNGILAGKYDDAIGIDLDAVRAERLKIQALKQPDVDSYFNPDFMQN